MRGIIIKTTGSEFEVETVNGESLTCKLKGAFRIKGIKSTNPLAVGDYVEYENLGENRAGIITGILPRKNYIIRKATKLSKQSHIIAANLDQAVTMASLINPRTSTGFIDRFLVTAEAYHIPAAIIFNKTDIYDQALQKKLSELISIYRQAGYPVYSVSILNKDYTDGLVPLFENKISLLSGPSGVGKSTLINLMIPGLNLKTKQVSLYHNKGQHVTTFACMHKLQDGGFIIDTPGIKEFGLFDFNKTEVAERFPEIRKLMNDCRFNNCTHIHEPGCAVLKGLDEGKISLTRYNSYVRIMNDDYWDETDYV